jgi:diacylglycerol O-acyltransferase/trehalose O-mycolyltransferase
VTTVPPWTSATSVRARRLLGSRLVEYELLSSVLRRPSRLRVLFPVDYARPGARFPVLYLLHGGGDDYRSWTDKGDAAAATEDMPFLVVMPDGGNGFYSDWVLPGANGLPRWETFHITELLPWVDRTFRTHARREARALAGLSMGGFGAMSYAARHPDLFVAAASFSGAVDTSLYTFIYDVAAGRDGGPPGAIWGTRRTDLIRWRAHNPVDLAGNLCGQRLVLRTGTGMPGELTPGARPDPIEAIVLHKSLRLHHRLRDLGIDHDWYAGPGGHDWPYWTRDLRATLPVLNKAFADPPPLSPVFRYTSAEPDYRVHGWSVHMSRPRMEFCTLHADATTGFSLTGSGTATVRTAPLFTPGGRYRAVVSGALRRDSVELAADPAGRLTVSLRLGPVGLHHQPTVRVAVERYEP